MGAYLLGFIVGLLVMGYLFWLLPRRRRTVYVLETGVYENSGASGVYESPQAAIKAHGCGLWVEDGHDRWHNDLDGDDHGEVVPFEVEG